MRITHRCVLFLCVRSGCCCCCCCCLMLLRSRLLSAVSNVFHEDCFRHWDLVADGFCFLTNAHRLAPTSICVRVPLFATATATVRTQRLLGQWLAAPTAAHSTAAASTAAAAAISVSHHCTCVPSLRFATAVIVVAPNAAIVLSLTDYCSALKTNPQRIWWRVEETDEEEKEKNTRISDGKCERY